MFVSQFAKGMRKATSNLYRSDTEETRMTEIIMDKGMNATLDYSGRILEDIL